MRRLFLFFLAAFLAVPASFAQNGPGWKSKTVAPGIVYHSFSGFDTVSGAPQEVFVIDWDTSNPSYALRYTWSDKQSITSDVFRQYNAVAAMNAAYEPESTVIKENGRYYSCMPKDTVMTTPVPNWKSEGAVYVDGSGRNVSIAFDGKGKSIVEQRAFYASSPWENIFTSAPMLIDNYEPVGAFFSDSTLTAEQLKAYNYEDPVRHQGVRHPRTAVALTENGHFLMVTVDGRKKGISEGMSARELTRFLERHFHPSHALNMDGGGSTTLCVRGEGDPVTHVVNYPSGNRKHDHAGERMLYSHFCLVEVPSAPREDARAKVLADRNLASGCDRIYDMSKKILTPSPKGYEPVFIEHYGRHGSRYAYTARTYSIPLRTLKKGAEEGNLTTRGKKLLSELDAFWQKGQYKVGELTPLGWEQQAWIGRNMVHSFSPAFGKGSVVDACSSASVRSIMSMSSCCATISREAPESEVYEHQGILDIQATRPNMGENPFRYTGPAGFFPYPETTEEYFMRKMPGYRTALGRLFKDADSAMEGIHPYTFFHYCYMLIAGMQSIPDQERIETDGLLTDEEFATMWEVDNYESFRRYLPNKTSCSSIVDDMIAKADGRLESGKRGADLRFGHDHVLLTLDMIMDIEGSGYVPASADDLPCSFRNYLCPKASNIQFVFYRPKHGRKGETLVKLLLNGEEARLGNLAPAQGSYYEWPSVKDYLNSRTALFVNR